MATVVAIAMHTEKRAPLRELAQANVSVEFGVEHDFRGKPGKRQVTVLVREAWESVNADLGTSLSWLERRANLYIEGLDLQFSAGKVLKIGALELLITRETDPCERMTDVHAGLFDALLKKWHGGVCCRVIHGGDIRIGDRVEIVDVK